MPLPKATGSETGCSKLDVGRLEWELCTCVQSDLGLDFGVRGKVSGKIRGETKAEFTR